MTAVVVTDYDRAAPRGVGNVKVAGNYAADLLPNMEFKKKGYPIALYLDSKTNNYIEEFSTSNFLAIDKMNRYITPLSDAILESVTNKSLMELAMDEGYEVQRRPVLLEELMNGSFVEAAACGTAVVVTPVNKIGTYVVVGDNLILKKLMNMHSYTKSLVMICECCMIHCYYIHHHDVYMLYQSSHAEY